MTIDMKKYSTPQIEAYTATTEHALCTPSDLNINRDTDKQVTTGWTRQQELWEDDGQEW